MESGKYDYLNAKLHGMRSGLFESDRLLALLALKNLPDLLRAIHPERMERFPTPSSVEKMIAERHFDVLRQTARDLPPHESELFRAIALRCELENLKVILQFWHMKPMDEGLAGLSLSDLLIVCPGPESPERSTERLLESADIEEFIKRLPQGKTKEFLVAASERYRPDEQIFPVLVSLDVQYYVNVWEKIRALSGGDREIATRLMGQEIDISNIIWTFRLRLNYGIEPERIHDYLCPAGYHLTDGLRREICVAADEAMMKERVPYPYGEVIGDRNVLDAESALWGYLYRAANREFYRSFFTIGVPVAFYVLKRIEMMNLARVIEGFRYELPAREIQRNLILVT